MWSANSFSNLVLNLADDEDSGLNCKKETSETPAKEPNLKVVFEEPDVLWGYDITDPTIGGITEEFKKPNDKKD